MLGWELILIISSLYLLHSRLHQEAMSRLENLRVCEMVPIGAGQRGVQLSEAFKRNLHTLVCGG